MANDDAPPRRRLGPPDDPTTRSHERIRRFVSDREPSTPCLVVDLDIVAERYRALADALPNATIFYAIKANPHPAILRLLVQLGSSFDVASVGEVDAALAAGATPDRVSYGNTIKKQVDIAYAFARGVRLFAFDSIEELDKLSAAAPGATVFCRILTAGVAADWPLSHKFGCDPSMALDLLRTAARRGHPIGVSFHVGSQQRDPGQWDVPLGQTAHLLDALGADGITPTVLNLGGGFPSVYSDRVPAIARYGTAIAEAIDTHLGDRRPPVVIAEPGRYLVGDAGVLFSEVVLVSRKSECDDRRWVYLDVGKFGGLVETTDEAIRYRIRTPHDGGPSGPVVLAGPTCDSIDVLYDKSDYHLPLALTPGDHVQLLSTGAYTSTYCSVGFNGFPPLETYCLQPTGAPVGAAPEPWRP
jgi:ornithine decarboxylase